VARQHAKAESLRVIVSGLSRTGTQTLKYALNSLGYKCYHSEELVQLGHNDLWLKAVASDATGEQALRVVSARILDLGYDCVLDLTWPWSARLLTLFPQAKVVHSVRDSPEKWFSSYDQISRSMLPLTGSRPFSFLVDFEFMKTSMREMALVPGYGLDNVEMAHPLPWVDHPSYVKDNREPLIAAYKRQQEVMEAVTPADQLLIYNVKQGWAPLCSFLEVGSACPEGHFPHLNGGQSFQLINGIMLFVCYAYPVLPLVPILGIILIFRLLRGLLRSACRANEHPKRD
jgi:hypothetical protein